MHTMLYSCTQIHAQHLASVNADTSARTHLHAKYMWPIFVTLLSYSFSLVYSIVTKCVSETKCFFLPRSHAVHTHIHNNKKKMKKKKVTHSHSSLSHGKLKIFSIALRKWPNFYTTTIPLMTSKNSTATKICFVCIVCVCVCIRCM